MSENFNETDTSGIHEEMVIKEKQKASIYIKKLPKKKLPFTNTRFEAKPKRHYD